jgi:AcrR family transcriptional regulator
VPDTALRSRQTQLTRDVVLEALAHVIEEQGIADFSVQDVADRAGVSHRTVYRHFPTREALLAALISWGEERVAVLGAAALPQRPDEVAPLVRRKFEALDQMAPFVVAALKLDQARLAQAQQSARSGQAMRSALAGISAHLPPDVAEVVICLIRQVGSSRMWLALREEEGIEGGRSADVVGWAIETLLEELTAGRGPAAVRS